MGSRRPRPLVTTDRHRPQSAAVIVPTSDPHNTNAGPQGPEAHRISKILPPQHGKALPAPQLARTFATPNTPAGSPALAAEDTQPCAPNAADRRHPQPAQAAATRRSRLRAGRRDRLQRPLKHLPTPARAGTRRRRVHRARQQIPGHNHAAEAHNPRRESSKRDPVNDRSQFPQRPRRHGPPRAQLHRRRPPAHPGRS